MPVHHDWSMEVSCIHQILLRRECIKLDLCAVCKLPTRNGTDLDSRSCIDSSYLGLLRIEEARTGFGFESSSIHFHLKSSDRCLGIT
ncbi:hypothetical protein TNCT_385261 [Trichonephila clavata]|uniref:Uncharacterized protein n=1 Tax=Trichonephila clavata TaxID=2740835 RepID=A0A8X6LE02_TRICU|nr:hypothetical protein TNCT_385261 [Trichonephila clavata]